MHEVSEGSPLHFTVTVGANPVPGVGVVVKVMFPVAPGVRTSEVGVAATVKSTTDWLTTIDVDPANVVSP
jgi:hypothetical protein